VGASALEDPISAYKATEWTSQAMGSLELKHPAWRTWRRRYAREARSLRMAVNPRFMFWNLLASALPNYALSSTRAWLYRAGGCDIGPGVTMQGPMLLLGGGPPAARLHIAEGSIVAPFVTFGLDADISIGRRVSVSPGTAFHTATHAIGFGSRRMQLSTSAHPIVVEDGVWIGMRCLVLSGVTLGHGSVLAAGAVVTESVPPNSLMVGNPATVRETLPFGNR
jgi:acetyltransferase-like isoleucine patch superfamily enzyme